MGLADRGAGIGLDNRKIESRVSETGCRGNYKDDEEEEEEKKKCWRNGGKKELSQYTRKES